MYVSTSGEYWRRNCISACSCATILSTTRLSVAGCWAAAVSGNALSARATGKMFRVRIMFSKAVGYEYSLVLAGFIVMFGLFAAKRLDSWTAIFLVSTVATSVTGFLFPFHRFLPSHAVGIVSLLVLAVAILARYAFHLAGAWRRTYAISAMIALYLNVFVLIAQGFQKVPSLKAMAPTQSEPPFLVTQLVVMVLFVVLTIAAARRFRSA